MLVTNYYIAIVFLRVLATGSGLGGKTRTQPLQENADLVAAVFLTKW
jgi:hypothetical protein